MDDQVKRALERDRTIDIITTGRKTGHPRRTEIWFHRLDDRLYITGLPGQRDWYANLLANPEFTFHLKESIQVDLSARARPILEESERREVLTKITTMLGGRDLDAWMEGSPLVEVELEAR